MIKRINRMIEEAEFNRFGIMSMTLTAGSCLGAIAVMLILQYKGALWELTLCSMVSMLANTLAIAQAPMKWMIWSFNISVLINGLFILWYLV